MKNTIVGGYEAQDIEKQVSKILRGLGDPDPPLSLDDVRELLRLDRRFYSGSDQSAAREVVSQVECVKRTICRAERRRVRFTHP
jgi:hypothetical protein